MAGILECILERYVFFGELAVEIRSYVGWGDRRWGCSSDWWLLGWGVVVGVLEDALGGGVSLQYR
jgi:hypothetical protein